MMLLNTKFSVDDSLTRNEFITMTNNWLKSSAYFNISLDDYNGEDEEFTVESEDSSKKVFIGNYSDVLILQIINSVYKTTDESVDEDDDEKSTYQPESATYTTNYVLRDGNKPHMLHISQEKILTELSLSKRQSRMKLPVLMRDVFWGEYGADDHGIMNDYKSIQLRKSDIELAKKIVTHEIDFDNPIVYVSPNSQTGYYECNADYLAQELMGQAHVVVESSPKVSKDIKDATNGANPFNGAVKIFLPGKKSTTLLPKDRGFNGTIIDTVRDILVNVGIDDEFNVTKIRQSNLFTKVKNGGQPDEEFAKFCEEMINDKDIELKQLKQELAVVKQQLNTANAKAESLQGGFQKFNDDKNGDCIEFEVTDKELYTDERKDVILKVLQKEYDAMKGDANLSRSRKFDVLGDVLEHNFPSETDTELIQCLRDAFKDGALSRAGIGCLQAAGFVVEKSGNQAHYRINFGNDERYEATFSSTPSDKARGTKNLVSDFTNVLFGF